MTIAQLLTTASLHRAVHILFLATGLAWAASTAAAQDGREGAGVGPVSLQTIDLQGHRGARGLVPENSVPSFLEALNHGVETLELDVVISADNEVVVSHEPWMAATICRSPDGRDITEAEERSFNIYGMAYSDVTAFDCGSRGHASFPRQRPTAVSKPLLRTVLRVADGYAHVTGRPAPHYNVEIKSDPATDGSYHPHPESFARIVYDVLAEEDVLDRSNIQSFDPRSIRAVRMIDPTLPVALLVSNDDGMQANLDRLGFVPEIYSPNHDLVDGDLVNSAHAASMRIVPWTVNSRARMERLLDLGVDGIITDYPGLGRSVIDRHQDATAGQ